MTTQEPRDGGMINLLVARDDPAAHIIEASGLDLARRAHALAVAVQHQAQQHLRRIRRRALAISTIAPQEPGQVELTDDLQDLPAQMLRRQPPTHVMPDRRRVVRATGDEVVSHGTT
nr:hypothetical protein [Micromonospora sp. RTP1Z1]